MNLESQAFVLEDKNFSRVRENFECDICHTVVSGNGYTNHCPKCLWSRHVDVKPGDRRSDCGGLMKPVSVTYNRTYYLISHKCLKCGETKNIKAAQNDSQEVLWERMKPGPLIL